MTRVNNVKVYIALYNKMNIFPMCHGNAFIPSHKSLKILKLKKTYGVLVSTP